MKKKWMVALVALMCSVVVSLTAWATAPEDVVVSLQIDNPWMQVNGETEEIDPGRGTSPLVTDGRTLVPIRAIIEAFGGTVGWDGDTQTVSLAMEGDIVTLVIDSHTAYRNKDAHTLDVAPAVMNDRTMLPIRFVAESFDLGVAWDGGTNTVWVLRNGMDAEEYDYLMREVPAYSGAAWVEMNGNVPMFDPYEVIPASFEYYSAQDGMGRCDVCMASVAEDIMPTGERESISSVTPTGWINAKYDVVAGGYLYNRCHLIGYQLTGENANPRNLITGTRHLNIEGMLPFENQVDDYIERTGNHVMYRVTPLFIGNNQVANGVLMEGYSVEDNGRGVSFCVYCYNVQPGIAIDYTTGASSLEGVTEQTDWSDNQEGAYGDWQGGTAQTDWYDDAGNEPDVQSSGIYRTPTGKRYHLDPDCGGKNSYPVTLDEALGAGLTPCKKCA
ncbi:MAG: hypothetical protein E7409_02285 [Ruminococcaceae bacterium]|nr:hypothetical protein [Oscillospiraceae bacterium]